MEDERRRGQGELMGRRCHKKMEMEMLIGSREGGEAVHLKLKVYLPESDCISIQKGHNKRLHFRVCNLDPRCSVINRLFT